MAKEISINMANETSIKNILSPEEYDRLKEKAENITLFGSPVKDLSKDDLMVALALSYEKTEEEKSSHQRTLGMFESLNKRR